MFREDRQWSMKGTRHGSYGVSNIDYRFQANLNNPLQMQVLPISKALQ
jgi:hypothetical protein